MDTSGSGVCCPVAGPSTSTTTMTAPGEASSSFTTTTKKSTPPRLGKRGGLTWASYLFTANTPSSSSTNNNNDQLQVSNTQHESINIDRKNNEIAMAELRRAREFNECEKHGIAAYCCREFWPIDDDVYSDFASTYYWYSDNEEIDEPLPFFEDRLAGAGRSKIERRRRGDASNLARVNGLNGLLVRGADLRHLPSWINQAAYFERKFVAPERYINARGQLRREPKALTFRYEDRARLVRCEPFGMDAYNVQYSLGKRRRWAFGDYFEENAEEFQHADWNITSVLLVSDRLPEPAHLHDEPFPPLIEGARTAHRVRRMVAAEPNGHVYAKETRTGRARPVDLLGPVPPLPRPTRQQPKHRKAARRFRRREAQRKARECQEPPIRLTYFISEPRPSAHLLSTQCRERFIRHETKGKRCGRVRKQRASPRLTDDDYYDPCEHGDERWENEEENNSVSSDGCYCSSDDHEDHCNDANTNYDKESAARFSLADFMAPLVKDNELATLPQQSTGSEKFTFLARPRDERFTFVAEVEENKHGESAKSPSRRRRSSSSSSSSSLRSSDYEMVDEESATCTSTS